jgi:hypothetical protein
MISSCFLLNVTVFTNLFLDFGSVIYTLYIDSKVSNAFVALIPVPFNRYSSADNNKYAR